MMMALLSQANPISRAAVYVDDLCTVNTNIIHIQFDGMQIILEVKVICFPQPTLDKSCQGTM